MHRVKVMETGGTTFVKENKFVLPAFDGELGVPVDAAMVQAGCKRVGDGEWNCALDLPSISGYLSAVATSDDKKLAISKWLRTYSLRTLLNEDKVPMRGGTIDWGAIKKEVDKTFRNMFPACL